MRDPFGLDGNIIDSIDDLPIPIDLFDNSTNPKPRVVPADEYAQFDYANDLNGFVPTEFAEPDFAAVFDSSHFAKEESTLLPEPIPIPISSTIISNPIIQSKEKAELGKRSYRNTSSNQSKKRKTSIVSEDEHKLFYAARDKRWDDLRDLLSEETKCSMPTRARGTLLHKVILSGQVDLCEKIYQIEGKDIDETTSFDNTALHIVVNKGAPEVLKWLITKKPNPFLKNENAEYPIDKASSEKKKCILQKYAYSLHDKWCMELANILIITCGNIEELREKITPFLSYKRVKIPQDVESIVSKIPDALTKFEAHLNKILGPGYTNLNRLLKLDSSNKQRQPFEFLCKTRVLVIKQEPKEVVLIGDSFYVSCFQEFLLGVITKFISVNDL